MRAPKVARSAPTFARLAGVTLGAWLLVAAATVHAQFWARVPQFVRYDVGSAHIGRLPDGRVVLVSEYWQNGGSYVQVYQPDSATWHSGSDPVQPTHGDGGFIPDASINSLTVLADGRVLFTGTSKAFLFDPATRSMRGVPSMPQVSK